MLEKIKENTFNHFMYLPKLLGFTIEIHSDFTIINCRLGSSMFNIVCSNNIVNGNEEIESIVNTFKNQSFAWWFSPLIQSKIADEIFIENGFVVEAQEHAMLCKLDHFEVKNKQSLTIEQVLDRNQLEDFIKILELYDETARGFYMRLSKPLLDKSEKLFVGYENKLPVVIAILFISGDTSGVFSLLTREDKRNLGYGTEVMIYLMNIAKAMGMKYIILSASNDSGLRIYKRLGFNVFGKFKCFEWKVKNKELL